MSQFAPSPFAPTIETIDYPFPPKPVPLSDAQKADYKARIKQLLIEKMPFWLPTIIPILKSKPLPKKPAAAFQTP